MGLRRGGCVKEDWQNFRSLHLVPFWSGISQLPEKRRESNFFFEPEGLPVYGEC
jgi:hypothetical protein